jgi:glyoxylase-like metal-dependent hydrolase (beta-lactamase superfamily II)
MSIQIGEFELTVVSGGELRIDGGNMFGVVPKVLWQRKYEPDDRNRIAMNTNCLLVKTPDGTVLIDTGYGSKCTERQRKILALQEGAPLLENLRALGMDPIDVNQVLLTHLHFDHAGGATMKNDAGVPWPTFPNARYSVQQEEWDDAIADRPELAGAYFKDDFLPIADQDKLNLLQGDSEVIPGIRVMKTGGHTRGHQIVYIESKGETAVYLADLCPLVGHLPDMWSMAYDQFPLETRRTKPKVLSEAADKDWLVIFGHDADINTGRLIRNKKGELVVVRDALPIG